MNPPKDSHRTMRSTAWPSSPLMRVAAVVMAFSAATIHVALAAPAKAAAKPPTGETERLYTVKAEQGDTFLKLAGRYFTNRKNWQPLAKHNPTVDPVKIPVGREIKMPVSVMRAELAGPTVVSVSGKADVNGAALAPGQKLNERDKLNTGDDGFVTIKLADGSTLTVQSKSAVELERTRQFANTKVGESVIRLASGRVETSVTKQNAAARYEVRTPTSNMGVRGTVFRAGADATGAKGLSEVVEGAVGLASASASPQGGLALNAGFGSVVEAGKEPSPPVKLLPQPTLTPFAETQLRADVPMTVGVVDGARGYRAQVAEDEGFQKLVAEVVSNTPALTLPNLPDGALRVRVRAIDAQGLEGLDATQSLTVAARPFAPKTLGPLKGTSVSSAQPKLSWAPEKSAVSYRMQVARDAAFATVVADEKAIAGVTADVSKPLASGTWFWRMASIDAKGKQGPFGDASTFVVRLDRLRVTPVLASGQTRLTWNGEAGVVYQFQVARRESFSEVLQDKIVSESAATITGLPKNIYFVRVRVVGAGSTPGMVKDPGEWSELQAVEVFATLF